MAWIVDIAAGNGGHGDFQRYLNQRSGSKNLQSSASTFGPLQEHELVFLPARFIVCNVRFGWVKFLTKTVFENTNRGSRYGWEGKNSTPTRLTYQLACRTRQICAPAYPPLEFKISVM